MKKFISTFLVLALLVLAIAGYLIFTGPRMKIQPGMRTFGQSMSLPPDGTIPVETTMPAAPTPEELDAFAGLPATEKNLRDGEVVYGYYCIFCHGKQGAGDGPVGKSYVPHPADLRKARVSSLSDKELLKAMFTGIGHEPVMGKVVPPDYRSLLILYVRSLAETQPAKVQNDPSSLEQINSTPQ